MFSIKNKTRNSQYISEQLQVHFHGTITTGCIQKTADHNLYCISTLNYTGKRPGRRFSRNFLHYLILTPEERNRLDIV